MRGLFPTWRGSGFVCVCMCVCVCVCVCMHVCLHACVCSADQGNLVLVVLAWLVKVSNVMVLASVLPQTVDSSHAYNYMVNLIITW